MNPIINDKYFSVHNTCTIELREIEIQDKNSFNCKVKWNPVENCVSEELHYIHESKYGPISF